MSPYHWDDRDKLQADYHYLIEFQERLLNSLAGQLNSIHVVDHSLHYWRILIGPWLGYFTQILFDRWSCIQSAVSHSDIADTIVLRCNADRFVPLDMSHFNRIYTDDPWNHWIYSKILRESSDIICLEEQWPPTAKKGPSADPPAALPLRRRFRRMAGTLYTRSAVPMVRDRDAFFLSTYLDLSQLMTLQLRLRQVPQLWTSPGMANQNVSFSGRNWAVEGESRSSFESFARRLIPQQLPVAYLEGYRDLVDQTKKLRWPKKPKVIFTSNATNSDDLFKAWAAEKIEQGSPLVIGQHGGHYGTGRWSFNEDHELTICDRFLSWGWDDERIPKVIPVGQLKPRSAVKTSASKNGILLVTCTLPRYSYWMYSVFVAGQYLDYFADQITFAQSLPAHLRSELTVRLFPVDWGLDQRERWADRFPEIVLDSAEKPLTDAITATRICVCTYNATTFLESFSMDIPTVMHWNPNHWELRDAAQPYFDDLKRVGVFHESAGSAARHVASIWADVDAWWGDPEVKRVVGRFIGRYCAISGNPVGRIERALRTAASDKRRQFRVES